VLLPALHGEGWWSRLHDSVVVWIGERGMAIGHKLQQTGEALSAQKATAVVASTAALTGGAVVNQRAVGDHASHRQEHGGHSTGPSVAARTGTASSPTAVAATPPRTHPAKDRTMSEEVRNRDAAAGEFSPEQTGSTGSATTPPAETVKIADTAGGKSNVRASGANGSPPKSGQEFGP
jgi:hypothetical protein